MSLNIVHFSRSPLAGAPIRLVRALQQHANYRVNLVDLKRWGLYDCDVIHAENLDEAVALAEKADIIHLHNYLDYRSTDFYPVNFESLRQQGKVFVRQFHSHPAVVAGGMQITVSELLSSPIPSLVIAQFQERFYPKAQIVPNIIPQHNPAYKPIAGPTSQGIFFSPTSSRSAWDDRWNTKGAVEVLFLLKQVARRTGCATKFTIGKPLAEVLEEKRKYSITIDDLVTGSYHLAGLEGLSLGKPVLAFLDDRIKYVLREISGSDTCPFINTRLEDAFEVLVYLLEHPDEIADLGQASRKWIENYWLDRILVGHYVDVYDKLLADPSLVVRQESMRLEDKTAKFYAFTLPDLVYQSRANRYYAGLPLIGKAWTLARRSINWLREKLVKSLPPSLAAPARSFWRRSRQILKM